MAGESKGTRVIALVGPAGAGKTSLAEAMLFAAGASDRLGSTANGSSIGDSSPESRQRGGSTELNLYSFNYLGDDFAILDVPGSVGFAADGARALAVADVAIVVVDPDPARAPLAAPALRASHPVERAAPDFRPSIPLRPLRGSLRSRPRHRERASWAGSSSSIPRRWGARSGWFSAPFPGAPVASKERERQAVPRQPEEPLARAGPQAAYSWEPARPPTQPVRPEDSRRTPRARPWSSARRWS